MESQTKLIKTNVDGETKVVVNAKLFLDINKDTAKLASQIEIKINLKYLEQDIKNKLLEKEKLFRKQSNKPMNNKSFYVITSNKTLCKASKAVF